MKDTRRDREGPGEPGPSHAAGSNRNHRGSPSGVALWFFIGVATTLFALFILSYAMRMDAADWSPIAMPWQLWLSTALLVAGSVTLQQASSAARDARWQRAHFLVLTGGICALAFLCVQLWAWQALLANRVMPVGNPAGSFFYLLTAMHGLHVIGGLAGWAITVHHMPRSAVPHDPVRTASTIALCARYWHFLLAVWVVLFATLGWLTPEIVRAICGTR
ncbi:bb3-type cytochrome oxidase subunit III [Noviherbaspirillum cavernae]|uniref:Bb3-type cytochrome oxidase subunit III n=1 Tax=Noviherbaspirillum cavernae TaxID=2320862 RepID=A0A418X612_9BURK|nr:bb3-type cytochrome oxidase subunit III [Noviherbaspirillum cavernae]